MSVLWKRVVVKLSGEALMGGQTHGLDAETVARIANDLATAANLGCEISVVVGGGRGGGGGGGVRRDPFFFWVGGRDDGMMHTHTKKGEGGSVRERSGPHMCTTSQCSSACWD